MKLHRTHHKEWGSSNGGIFYCMKLHRTYLKEWGSLNGGIFYCRKLLRTYLKEWRSLNGGIFYCRKLPSTCHCTDILETFYTVSGVSCTYRTGPLNKIAYSLKNGLNTASNSLAGPPKLVLVIDIK